MNKKISTLLCASLLLSSAFTAVNAADLTGIANGLDASAVVKLDKAALNGVYQLRVTSTVAGNTQNGVLAIEDGKYVVKTTGYNLQNSLWCIKITEQGQGKEPIYDFINKATGEFLAIAESDVQGLALGATTANALSVGETYGGWAFARTYSTVLEQNQPMFTYQEADHVLILKENNGELYATKVLASAARGYADAVKFTVYDAGTYVLSANEINSYLKDNKNVLTFNLDANADVNPFSTNEFVAKASKGNVDVDHNFVNITAKANANSYLKVDTAANGVGIQFLKFGWTDATKETAGDISNSKIAGQHNFLFSYKPSTDSLFIQVQEARYKTEKAPEKTWLEVVNGAGVTYTYGANYADVNKTDADMDAVNVDCNPSKLFVKLQNFTVADRIATIGERPINTHIGFGLKGCTPTNDKTSLENGLYIIKNAKGQVLAAPIHENDNNGNNKLEWVTLDEQEPLHMPAYQWVITKTLSNPSSLSTSPIKIVNREFPSVTNWANIQLRLNDKGEIVTDAAGATVLASGITYSQIKDEKIIKDKKLGYKYIASQDLQITKYRFNYLNPFTQNYWIANGDKDSLVYVKQSADEFSLIEGSTSTYGIVVDAALLDKIPNLAQLERTNYAISQDKSDRLVKAYGSKFSMGAANYGTIAEVDSFFFKENNHFNEKDFYAILETEYSVNKAIIKDIDETAKVGIADDGMTAGLKVQLLNESRTSSFTVEPSTTPLYRRFNCATLNEKADDKADTLRFVETIRHEYLMDEMNENLTNATTDYAGIWAKGKSEKLAFHVDTAWVERGFGYIKPQYLISVDRQEVAAVPGVPCTYTHNHYDNEGHAVDAAHCSHATPGRPGYNVAKYLVSFADSVAKDNATMPKYTDVKGGYVRVGFVKAIQEGDSLYFLVNGFEKKANGELSVDEVVAAYKKAGIYNTYVRSLVGDKHKNYTWSFRYVDPEKAANEVEADRSFLIESNTYDTKAIAPESAAWLKMQNGYLVLTDDKSTFSNAKTGGDGALVFNVENIANDQLATDNDKATVSEVSVISGEGQVTIAGAAGKKVVITNILGQVVANTVIASDNAPIAAPAGVVVVAVEGEDAVKAIVK